MNDETSGLRNNDQDTENPFVLFNEWLNSAVTSEPNDPSAMSLASVDSEGMPNVRIVLMRRFDERGFCFFTNFESQKGEELLASKKAGAVFHWKSLRKQIRIRGEVEPVRDAEADDYFNTRHRSSRIGAHASKQSRPLESRFALEKEVAKFTAKFGVGEVPRPEYWSGFRLMPLSIEFWNDGKFRLHDRKRFDRDTVDGAWNMVRLYP